ncbi:hypothetical protein C3L29_031630, partial [Pseudomonas sp. MWU12-2534b]
LFTLGRLMVKERRAFQRVYDLAERVLPNWDDARDLPSPEAVRREQVRNSCRALGLAKPAWVADYYRLKRAPYSELLHGLADQGELIPVKVEGWSHDAFVHASLAAELELAREGKLNSGNTAILSPFDSLVWDRKRALELFDFDYKTECYTPAPKRKYGYFTLPILNRGKLIGRLDAKAHRAQGVFEVKSLHLEPGVRVSQRLAGDLQGALSKLAAWHGAPRLAVSQAPDGLAERLLA